MWDSKQHTYEEIRAVIIDILLESEKVAYSPEQWASLISGVAEVFGRRERSASAERTRLHPFDAELVRDAFWDLFRQGFITLGLNDSNPEWPWFRLSHFGKNALQSQNPYRFHDQSSFLAIVQKEIPDISSVAITYLAEAVSAFYADCLLASTVMLGVAAEAEFLRLIDVASNGVTHGAKFIPVFKGRSIREKITKFQSALAPIIPTLSHRDVEDLDTNLAAIQSVLRIARNDAGHPTPGAPQREQVYVLMQLFVPFARQLMRLRYALS